MPSTGSFVRDVAGSLFGRGVYKLTGDWLQAPLGWDSTRDRRPHAPLSRGHPASLSDSLLTPRTIFVTRIFKLPHRMVVYIKWEEALDLSAVKHSSLWASVQPARVFCVSTRCLKQLPTLKIGIVHTKSRFLGPLERNQKIPQLVALVPMRQ